MLGVLNLGTWARPAAALHTELSPWPLGSLVSWLLFLFFFIGKKGLRETATSKDDSSASGHELSDRSRKITGNVQKVVEGKQTADKAQPLPSTEKSLIGQKLAGQKGACSYEPGVEIQEMAHR